MRSGNTREPERECRFNGKEGTKSALKQPGKSGNCYFSAFLFLFLSLTVIFPQHIVHVDGEA